MAVGELVANHPDAQESMKKKARLVYRRGRKSQWVWESWLSTFVMHRKLEKESKVSL